MYIKNPALPGKFVASFTGLWRAVFNKWYVDELYDALVVNPTKKIGTFCWKGFDVRVVDGAVNGIGKLINVFSNALRYTQTGFAHNYAMTMALGVVAILAFYVFR